MYDNLKQAIVVSILVILLILGTGCMSLSSPQSITMSSNGEDRIIKIDNMGGTRYEGSSGYNVNLPEAGNYTIYFATTKQDESRVHVYLHYTPNSSIVSDRFGGHSSYERESEQELGITDIYGVVNRTVTTPAGTNSFRISAKCFNELVCEVHMIVKKVV